MLDKARVRGMFKNYTLCVKGKVVYTEGLMSEKARLREMVLLLD